MARRARMAREQLSIAVGRLDATVRKAAIILP